MGEVAGDGRGGGGGEDSSSATLFGSPFRVVLGGPARLWRKKEVDRAILTFTKHLFVVDNPSPFSPGVRA